MKIKYERSCGAVIIKEDKVLLIKSKKGNHWSFPKGHQENGETDIETAIREVKEEANVDISLDASNFIKINYSPLPGVSKDVIYFYATFKSGVVKAQFEEVSEIGWFSIDDALDNITFQQEKDVLIEILKKKRA